MPENWKPIPGYTNYDASDLGKIKIVHPGVHISMAGKILKPTVIGNGYLSVALRESGVRRRLLLHRLIMLTFVGSPETYGIGRIEVNHINGDKTDNRLSNLEYMTPHENKLHAYRVLGIRHSQAKLTIEEVKEIRVLYASGQYTQTELGRMFNIDQTTVHQIVRRKTWITRDTNAENRFGTNKGE
jgi:NUMOD4 motif/HNH endonuclease